jgi:small glutamine-rich tetratricopeptide repeat-containing protein alpha
LKLGLQNAESRVGTESDASLDRDDPAPAGASTAGAAGGGLPDMAEMLRGFGGGGGAGGMPDLTSIMNNPMMMQMAQQMMQNGGMEELASNPALANLVQSTCPVLSTRPLAHPGNTR